MGHGIAHLKGGQAIALRLQNSFGSGLIYGQLLPIVWTCQPETARRTKPLRSDENVECNPCWRTW